MTTKSCATYTAQYKRRYTSFKLNDMRTDSPFLLFNLNVIIITSTHHCIYYILRFPPPYRIRVVRRNIDVNR